MRKLIAIALVCALGGHLMAAEPTTLYVATNGNNTWSGKLAEPNAEKTDGPFATIQKAKDAVRQLKKSGALAEGATIQVRGGT